MAERKETLVIDLKVVDNASKVLKNTLDVVDKSIAALGGSKGTGKGGGEKADAGGALERSSDIVLQNLIRARKELDSAGKALEKSTENAGKNLSKTAKIFKAGAQGGSLLRSIGGMMQAGGATGGAIGGAAGAMAAGGGLLAAAGGAIGGGVGAMAGGIGAIPGAMIGTAVGAMVEAIGSAAAKAFMGATSAVINYASQQEGSSRFTGRGPMVGTKQFSGAEMHAAYAGLLQATGTYGGGAATKVGSVGYGAVGMTEVISEQARQLGISPMQAASMIGGMGRATSLRTGDISKLSPEDQMAAVAASGSRNFADTKKLLIAGGYGGTRTAELMANITDTVSSAARSGATMSPQSIAMATSNIGGLGGVAREMAPTMIGNLIQGNQAAAAGGGGAMGNFRFRSMAAELQKVLGRAPSWEETQSVLAGGAITLSDGTRIEGADLMARAMARGAKREGRSGAAQRRMFAMGMGMESSPLNEMGPILEQAARGEIGDKGVAAALRTVTKEQEEKAGMPGLADPFYTEQRERAKSMEELLTSPLALKAAKERLSVEKDLIETGLTAGQGLRDLNRAIRDLGSSGSGVSKELEAARAAGANLPPGAYDYPPGAQLPAGLQRRALESER